MSANDRQPMASSGWLDNFSTEELRSILRRHSELPNIETPDINTILAIMEELAERERRRQPEDAPDVERAWASFEEDYLPCASELSLYDEGDNAGDCAPQRTHGRRHFRSMMVVAATVAVLFACSLTAYAFGFDVFGAIANWTKETFNFEAASAPAAGDGGLATTELPEEFAGLREHLLAAGITDNIIPSYVPEGYGLAELSATEYPTSNHFTCALQSGENALILSYVQILDGQFSTLYQKNNADPEVYEIDGVTYYVIQNAGSFSAAWVIGNTECSIANAPAHDELIKMLYSI